MLLALIYLIVQTDAVHENTNDATITEPVKPETTTKAPYDFDPEKNVQYLPPIALKSSGG